MRPHDVVLIQSDLAFAKRVLGSGLLPSALAGLHCLGLPKVCRSHFPPVFMEPKWTVVPASKQSRTCKAGGRGDAQKHARTVLYPRSAMGDGAWDAHTPLGPPALNTTTTNVQNTTLPKEK